MEREKNGEDNEESSVSVASLPTCVCIIMDLIRTYPDVYFIFLLFLPDVYMMIQLYNWPQL